MHLNAQCNLCASSHPPHVTKSTIEDLGVAIKDLGVTIKDLGIATASNATPSSIFVITNFAATPRNYHAPNASKPTNVHPSIALPTMACQKMIQPGAASDGAVLGTTCHGNAHHGAA